MSQWHGGKGSKRRNPNEKSIKKIGTEYLKTKEKGQEKNELTKN